MDSDSKKIGIWGYGIVGKSALSYFSNKNIATTIMESKELSIEEREEIKKNKGSLLSQNESEKFFKEHDTILASPGINIQSYAKFHTKFITELDLFHQENTSSVIAITGTIGKTTVTQFLSTILRNYATVATGGNIGVGMLDLLKRKDLDTTILEVSSFQLEHCKQFAPDLAVWTNFYSNHLDRHANLEEYFNAKYMILKNQNETQQALIPLELAPQIVHKNNHDKYKGTVHFFSHQKPCHHIFSTLQNHSSLFWIEQETVMCYSNKTINAIYSLQSLPQTTFINNWLIIIATLYLYKIPLNFITTAHTESLEHRIEKIGTYNRVDFYNDSKATIMESTLAAVEKLQTKPIILFLGGLSKGIDRSIAIEKLSKKVKYILCFGKEAEELYHIAQRYSVPTIQCITLEEAFKHALTIAQPYDQILFSPGGSSYDLFKNYEERGTYFKNLFRIYTQQAASILT